MSDSINGTRVKRSTIKKIRFKNSKKFSSDIFQQKEKRYTKHDRKEKLDLLRLDELAEVDDLKEYEEILSDYEELV